MSSEEDQGGGSDSEDDDHGLEDVRRRTRNSLVELNPVSQGSITEVRTATRKFREGVVVSVAMDKTAVVKATDRVRHRRYAKTVQRSVKLFAHDERNEAKLGDRVRIQETRPISKKKRWRLVEIIERAR